MSTRNEGLIPIISMSNSMIQKIIESNISCDATQGEGIIAYLIGDISYDSPLGNPLIRITQVVEGIEAEDEVFPSKCGENQISIRYESFPEEMPEPDPTLLNEHIMDTVHTVFSQEKTIYKIVCYHYFQNNDSVFRFYFPFPTFKTTFEEIGESQKPTSFLAGSYPKLQYKATSKLIDAQISGAEGPDDVSIQPIIADLAARFPTTPIHLTIGNIIYNLHVQQQSTTKMFYATALVSDPSESISLCFGRISTKTDMRSDIQALGNQVMETKEDIKSIVEQMSSMKNEISELKSLITDLATVVKNITVVHPSALNSPQHTETAQPLVQSKSALSFRKKKSKDVAVRPTKPEEKPSPKRPTTISTPKDTDISPPKSFVTKIDNFEEPKVTAKVTNTKESNFEPKFEDVSEKPKPNIDQPSQDNSSLYQYLDISPNSSIKSGRQKTEKSDRKKDKLDFQPQYTSPQTSRYESITPQKTGIPESPQLSAEAFSIGSYKKSSLKRDFPQMIQEPSAKKVSPKISVSMGEQTQGTQQLFSILGIKDD
ncbi:hypothetical protein TVAG_010090 [Trichomonas vaginalis G3]|uniref:Uncharacterized protein n=1 Tax=Trichomonas vaginalis (strain ATCC PRA-98 / G3) TaxID=412133 RepID=A2FA25_TRIV3|nr:hypothetical protein TVAGG3_0082690 [Trichomonas vaginalis G3]EAX98233.1 hypothetical protein TVAG_010090 [Trichomonas vaginalis G3]KAI5543374.1 hypothetical protein TVAGG3_0082690 [Trichomonas vaginalis G3]|eukprot:XP_001311163.1 hypothetical protein [Trichomonas vaginalis G3]